MRLGVSLSSSLPEDGPRLMIERAATAHDAGFDSLSVGDHHNMATPYAQNTPILGRLLAEWTERPAGCLFLVPLWHPVLMAEHIGTLAATHDGPFIVQTGIGYGDDQFRAMGADLSTRGKVLEATIEAVQAMLDGLVVDDERLNLVGGRVGLTPPEPVDWWIGGHADVAIRRAARMGDAWYGGPSIVADDEGKAMIDTYRSAGGRRVIVRKDALVLADGDDARRQADEVVAAGYRGMTLDALLVGNGDDVAEQLASYEALGVDDIIVRCMSRSQDVALETLSILGGLSEG
jgi:alkanesulfonate monooxygenase SsuD/methylene tetrahydromethanopterin reductase-like flavin-dependent oxidoreductase (luciferase family)